MVLMPISLLSKHSFETLGCGLLGLGKDMQRREFITLFGAAATWPLAARAEQAGKVYRIGFLANDPTIPTQPAGQAFLDGLRENGFVEGKNIIIERRFAE